MTNKTSLVCLTALLAAGSGCSAITNFDGLTGGDTGGELADASFDASQMADAGRDAFVPIGADADMDAAPEPDATSDAFVVPDATQDAFVPPDAFHGDAATPEGCPPLFRNPATVPAGARGLTLVQTISGITGPDRLADIESHTANVNGLAITATEAVATHWNGYIMRYARDAATGRLTYEEDHYIGDNTTGVIARRHGGFMTTAAYRYPASVPLIREYPTSDFRMYETEVEPMRFVFSGRGALTTPGNDFGPVPANIWGIVEAPTGIFYAAALGRTELRGTTARDTRILRIDPAFPAMPDGVDRSDAAALGGDSAYLGLRRLEADDRYLYWVTGTDENFASDPFPAQPHRVSRAPFVGCGSSLGRAQHFGVNATPNITALAAHPDGRIFAGSPFGLTIIPASWSGASTTIPLPSITYVQDMQFSPDGNRLIITGTTGSVDFGTEAARILVLDTSTATPTVLRTYGPGMTDGTFPVLFRPGAIRLYGPYVYIASHFASGAGGTPNMHVFTWAL
jgi:hypothetical protein